MKHWLIILSFFPAINVVAQNTSELTGIWEGKLNAGVELRIVFHFNKNAYGTYTGSLDSPDQGAGNIPCSNITLTADSVLAEVQVINGSFRGFLQNDSTLAGKWRIG